MKARNSNSQPLKDVIERLLKTYKIDGRLAELDAIAAWEKVMGPAIAKRTQNIYVRNSVLHVELTSASLRKELSFSKARILELLNEAAKQDVLKGIELK